MTNEHIDIAQRSGTPNVGMLSIGAYRPERIVTNDEICERIDSSDEWITTRTGIKTRRFARADETVTTMAIEAGKTALANALLTAADIDTVIVATSTNFRLTPGAAPQVATGIGANGIAAFDLSAGCAGFGYASGVAADLVRSGSASKVLVIGSEQLSCTVDPTDRGISFIFGDGAGAVVIGETDRPGIGPVVWGSDGSQSEAIAQDVDWMEYLEGGNPTGVKRPYMKLAGTAVFRWAAFEMGKVAVKALEAAKVDAKDLDVFIPHQANSRINELLAKNLGMREDAVVADDIRHTGNTSAASVPLAMEDLLSSGRAKPGDLALLLGYGSGLSYAAQVIRVPAVPFE